MPGSASMYLSASTICSGPLSGGMAGAGDAVVSVETGGTRQATSASAETRQEGGTHAANVRTRGRGVHPQTAS